MGQQEQDVKGRWFSPLVFKIQSKRRRKNINHKEKSSKIDVFSIEF